MQRCDNAGPNRKTIGKVEALRLQLQVELSCISKQLSQDRPRGYDSMVKHYRIRMKSFTDLCRQADMLVSLAAMKNSYSDLIPKRNRQFITRVREEFQQTPKASKLSLNEYFTTGSESSKRRYAADTFNMKVHRELTTSAIKSQQHRDLVRFSLIQSRTRDADPTGERSQQKEWFEGIAKLASQASTTPKHKRSTPRRVKSPQPHTYFNQPSFRTEEDSTRQDINYLKTELSRVKLLLSTLAKEIDTHTHSELVSEVQKLKSNYSRMNSNIDSLQSQNQRLLENIHELNKELRKERKKFNDALTLTHGKVQYRSESRLHKGRRHLDEDD